MFRRPALPLALAFLLPALASAADPAALLEQAAAHYAEYGRQRALTDFSADPAFQQDGLYVFCVDGKGTMTANGGFPRMVGLNIDRFDLGGERQLGQRMRELVALADGSTAEIDYVWLNPLSGAAERKHSVLRRFGQDVCGVGVYTPLPRSGQGAR